MKKNKDNILAICIAEAGYGTSSYDPETYECFHECYAGVIEVILNKEYWDQYDGCMSTKLNHDFGLGFSFNKYEITVYKDGAHSVREIS